MRDEPHGAVHQREPMMESVPAQRSHEDADDGDRAVGVAPVPDGAEEADDARARDDEFRPAENATTDTATTDAERADAERADAERVDAERADAERVDAERAGEWNGRSAVDVELPEDAAARDDAAAHEDAAAREETAWDNNRPDGGVPDDAVSSADAPVPAAAYESADSGEHIESAERDEAADDRAGDEAHAELMPGDVPEQPVDALFDQAAASDFRDRWQRVQMQFVDDPRAAADEARSLVDDVLNALHDGLNNQRGALDGWQSGQPDDTEQLRVAIRRYRDFMDRMLGL